jgi:hypothetical protein
MKNDWKQQLTDFIENWPDLDNPESTYAMSLEVVKLVDQQIASTIQQCVLVLEGMKETYWDDEIQSPELNPYNRAITEAITKIKELGE